MKINLKVLSDKQIESTVESTKMRLSSNAATMVFQMFTSRIYSNPIGSVVREITSNCFDSHVEAGVNLPVVIRKTIEKDSNTINISFIDFGVGISPDRMENIYSVYFESTKRQDNSQIGGFGIGCKLPLAYKRKTGLGDNEYDNTFYCITNYNGIKYYYCIYEGPDSPVMSLLHQEATTEGNGTEIRIPVLEKDLANFKKEMVRQLYYFENIIFEGFVEDEENKTSNEEILTNQYQIVRGKSFLFRGNQYSSYVHVCLGRVAYPIDYSILGLYSSDFQLPVALRLEIGEIGVTSSREQLDYSEKTIKLLKKKLNEVVKEITEMLGKQYSSITTLEDYFKAKTMFGELFLPNGESIQVGKIIKPSDVDFSNFKCSFMKLPTDKQLFRFFFEAKTYGKKPRKKIWTSNQEDENDFQGSYEILTKGRTNMYYFEGEFERKIVKQAWLKHSHQTYYMISKKNIVSKFKMSTVAELFNVDDSLVSTDDKGNTVMTDYGKSLLELQEEYFEIVKKYCTDYTTIEIPQTFIDDRKLNREKLSQETLNTTIPVKIIGGGGTYRVKLESLFKLNVPIFYGTKDDELQLSGAKRIYSILFNDDQIITYYDKHYNTFNIKNKQGILFVRLAKDNIKYMEYCRKSYPITKFNGMYIHKKSDAVTEYFQSMNLVLKFESIDELYRCPEFSNISPAWAKKVSKVQKYCDKVTKGNKCEWSKFKDVLAKYYDLINIKTTKEQNQYIKIIDDLKKIENLNADTMKYINTPYYYNRAEVGFWNLLKKVLVY